MARINDQKSDGKGIPVITPESIKTLSDNQVLFVADQLGLIGREKESVDQIRDGLKSLTYQVYNFLEYSTINQWLEPVESTTPVRVVGAGAYSYDTSGPLSMTFFNGRLNGPVRLETTGNSSIIKSLVPEGVVIKLAYL